MKRYFICCLLVLAVCLAGCSSNSDYTNNGTFAVSAATTTLAPGSGTVISAKYTTTAQLILDGNDTSFSSNRPDLVTFSSATVKSDGSGAASTGLTVIATAQIPLGGVDVVVTGTFRGLSSNITIHINPGTGATLSLTVPSSANLGTSFAMTAFLTPLLAGKTLTFSSDNPNLISFSTLTSVTDGTGSTVTVVSVKSTVAIPTAGVDVAFSVTDGTVSASKVIHINSTPASNTSISLTAPVAATSGSSFTISAVINPAALGKTLSFSSNRSDLISFFPQTNITDGTGSATTVVTVSSAVIPTSGVDVALSVTEGTVNAMKVVHINPVAAINATITLTAPATATSGSSFTITAAASPAVSGKSISYSSNRADLISFVPPTATTDGAGTAITAVTVDPLMTLPAAGVDVTLSATDGAVSAMKVVHVNPAPANSTTITLTAPTSATSGSSFTITAAASPAVSGKSIAYSSNRSDLISFVPATVSTDGVGSTVTAVSVNPAVTIPAGGVDVTFSATDGTVTTKKVVHINSVAIASSALKLSIPALVDRGSSYALTAVLSPLVSGDTVTFSSNSPVLSFTPASAKTDGSGTAKSIVAVSSATIPLNGLDVTVQASDGTASDLQVVHVNGSEPALFSVFPTSLDMSNIVATTTKTIQIVPPTPGVYNYSAASRAPFIIDVQSVNNTTGAITLTTASIVQSCTQIVGGNIVTLTPHTGTVIIEIKDNSPSNAGPTLYYPVTYSLCW